MHPETKPEGEEFSPEKRESLKPMVKKITQIAQANSMPLVFPERMISTRRAIEATEYSREQGKLLAFHKVIFQKFYGQGQDISSWEVLRATAEEVGLDADAMQRKTESGAYRDIVERQTFEAQNRGINQIPTFVLNDSYAVVGAQPYEVFQLVLQQMAQGG
ncbi:MAG: hypothetical protein PWP47_639 [Synergistaceae bacterium]|nr:hypothetical protein [Synergistaceae bacterium]